MCCFYRKHSDDVNEICWRVCWRGPQIFSHGNNVSAGVAVLFSLSLAVNIISQKEVCKGRLLKVRANNKGQIFVFLNMYAHNTGREMAVLFGALRPELALLEQDDILVFGGDFNCTIDPLMDRTGRSHIPVQQES